MPIILPARSSGLLNAARSVEKHVAVAELPVRKHRDRGERRAAPHPTEKYPHLQLANVELQIAGEPRGGALRTASDDDVQIEILPP